MFASTQRLLTRQLAPQLVHGQINESQLLARRYLRWKLVQFIVIQEQLSQQHTVTNGGRYRRQLVVTGNESLQESRSLKYSWIQGLQAPAIAVNRR